MREPAYQPARRKDVSGHDHDETHIRELAQFVNDKIADLRRRTGAVATHSLALLAALDIADEYFQERQRREDLRDAVGTRVQAIIEQRQIWEKTMARIMATRRSS